MSRWVEEGKQLLHHGELLEGERALRIAVKENPRSVEAWLWLSQAVQSDAEKMTCLLKVLELDSRNLVARQMLAALQEKGRLAGGQHVDPFKLDEPDETEQFSDPFKREEPLEKQKVNIEPLSETELRSDDTFAMNSEIIEGNGKTGLSGATVRNAAKYVIIALILVGITLIVAVLILLPK